MKQIIKSILIVLAIVCTINCSKVHPDIDETTSNNQTTDDLSYKLRQKHLETCHQTDFSFGSNKETHRIVDVNKIWLEFSNGYYSDPLLFQIVYTPLCTGQVSLNNLESYLNTTIYYDNGFKIAEDLIECSFIPENTDNLILTVNDKTIELPFQELLFCTLTPISLHIDNVKNNYIYATLLIEIYHPDNVLIIGDSSSIVESTETMEIPVNIRH